MTVCGQCQIVRLKLSQTEASLSAHPFPFATKLILDLSTLLRPFQSIFKNVTEKN